MSVLILTSLKKKYKDEAWRDVCQAGNGPQVVHVSGIVIFILFFIPSHIFFKTFRSTY